MPEERVRVMGEDLGENPDREELTQRFKDQQAAETARVDEELKQIEEERKAEEQARKEAEAEAEAQAQAEKEAKAKVEQEAKEQAERERQAQEAKAEQEKSSGLAERENTEPEGPSNPTPTLETPMQQRQREEREAQQSAPESAQPAYNFGSETSAMGDDMINLNQVKGAKNRTRFQNAVAKMCGIRDNKNMTKLNTLGSILWCGAKFTVASVVFGPLVGGWLVAHMNNHEYFSAKEEKFFNFINSFSFSEDRFVKGPTIDKGHVIPAK